MPNCRNYQWFCEQCILVSNNDAIKEIGRFRCSSQLTDPNTSEKYSEPNWILLYTVFKLGRSTWFSEILTYQSCAIKFSLLSSSLSYVAKAIKWNRQKGGCANSQNPHNSMRLDPFKLVNQITRTISQDHQPHPEFAMYFSMARSTLVIKCLRIQTSSLY